MDLAGTSVKHALKVREETLGKTHPDTLMSVNNVGSLLSAMGNGGTTASSGGAGHGCARSFSARSTLTPRHLGRDLASTKSRPNLQIETNSLATKLLFDNKRCKPTVGKVCHIDRLVRLK